MKILGITGGVATGKSTVMRMLSELGVPTISADAVAHTQLAPGTETTRAVLDAFPDCRDPTGQGIDRHALGKCIFADPVQRTRLEALTHPAIIAALSTQISEWRTAGSGVAAAAEIPLLFEANLESLVDYVVVVVCTEATQVARLQARQGMTEAEARRQIGSQWPLTSKIDRADVVIKTDKDLDDTRRQVRALWDSL